MSVNIAGYVEVKGEDGKWKLVTEHPVCSRLKYIIEDYIDLPRLKWDYLSEDLQKKYQKDENGEVYASFYTTTVYDIETKISDEVKDTFTKLNVIVKALGANRMYSDDGEEMMYDSDSKDKLTFPVNKELIDTIQYGYDIMRKIGQKEAFDLFINEHIDYGKEHRIVLVAT